MKTKMKRTILALSACSIAILPAQAADPKKPAAEKTEKVEQLKAETPVEKQAFKMFDLLGTLPDILGSIKDKASLAKADAKLTEFAKKMKAEEAALLKFKVPDNASRTKISKQRLLKEKAMSDKMMPVMMGMQKLDPAVAMKLGPMMEKIQPDMEGDTASTEKYFKTDEELKADEELKNKKK